MLQIIEILVVWVIYKRYGKMTYGDIYEEFCKKFPNIEVKDYRPASPLHIPQLLKDIPNAIIVWLMDGSEVVYIAEGGELMTDQTLKDIDRAFKALEERDELLDKIRTEIMDTGAYEQEVNGKTEFLKGINYCLGVINKYRNEEVNG